MDIQLEQQIQYRNIKLLQMNVYQTFWFFLRGNNFAISEGS